MNKTSLLSKLIRPNIFQKLSNSIKSMSTQTYNEKAKEGFSKGAEIYEKTRPSYLPETIEQTLSEFNIDAKNSKEIPVLDLAAGTGKFTKLLLNEKCLKVYSVEPNDNMRDVFSKSYPNAHIAYGTSTNIPFQNEFFQIVFVAQAFHWFANVESLLEISRVLKAPSQVSSGKTGLVLVWNMEDREAEPYIGELRDLYELYDSDVPQYRRGVWKEPFQNEVIKQHFTPLNTKIFRKCDKVYLPLSHIWQRILSKSYIARLSNEEQAKLKEKVDNVFEKYKSHQVKIDDYDEACLNFPCYSEFTWCFKK